MKCLACESALEIDVAIIGDQFPSAIYLEGVTEEEFGLEKSSLNLSQCQNSMCNLVQLTMPVNLDLVYKHYPYQSGTTATMHSILTSVVDEAFSYIALDPGDVILDIGGNDGTLLSLIERPDCELVNIDAASNIQQVPQAKNYTYINAKFSKDAYHQLDYPSPKIIFNVAVFYQLSNPLQFLKDVVEIMNDDSLFVLQMTYLESMYSNSIFDNIVHEHITYFSLKSLSNIVELAGLRIVGARVVDSYGGSLRVFLVRSTSKKTISKLETVTREIIDTETENKTNEIPTLSKFGNDFEIWKTILRKKLDVQVEKNGQIIGLGASTKGNMILQSLGINQETMPVILDNNPKKIGSRTTGSFIPIVDEDDITELEGNVMSLPYYYDEFFKKMVTSKIGKGQFVDFISPLPIPKITRISG
jgi:NDP-4-keto-2,6-dideoxyhexose 3-C-methyltransferase